jgi:uncharacterized delta-60 repeat protein
MTGIRAIARRPRATLALTATLLLLPTTSYAASPGGTDPAYGNSPPDAILQGTAGGAYEPGGLQALDDGSSIVAVGDALGITKLDSSGHLDSGFGTGGTVTVPAVEIDNASSNAVAVTPDGASYLVAGALGGNTDLGVAELNADDGSLDTSFASGGRVPGVYELNENPVQGTAISSSVAQGIVVQPDGTIIVVGTANIGSPSEPALFLDRIASNGAADARFLMQANGQPTEGDAVALGPGGTIYVAGTENPGTNSARAIVARVVWSGFPTTLKLDSSFDSGGSTPGVLTSALGGSSAELDALAVAPDGDAVMAGQVVVSGTQEAVVARLTTLGSLDPSFGTAGIATLPGNGGLEQMSVVTGLVLEPNGAPVIAGDSNHADPTGAGSPKPTVSFVAQLTPGGTLDTGFNPGGTPGVEYQTAQSDLTTGYDDGEVTGLAADKQGRLLVPSDVFTTGGTLPDEGIVQRLADYAPPTAAFSPPAAVVAGQAVTFDATPSTDAVGTITDYAWDFDGSDTFATDAGGATTVQHTFDAAGTVLVSLRVTNAVGQTSILSYPVTVLAQSHTLDTPGPAPRVSLSTRSLSFRANINEFNGTETDTPPQTVTVTNDGSGPLTISGAHVINSVGGFAISDRCISVLGGNGSYSSSCTPTKLPADTCSGATLAPGTDCTVSIQYQDGGQYPSATGTLAVESDAPSSPDLVTLSAAATIISGTSVDNGPSRCPGDITDEAGQLQGCWTDVTNSTYTLQGDTWAAFGPVTINGQLTLVPTSPDDELYAANSALSATPTDAEYTVEVSSSAAVPSIPVGVVDLGRTPLLCMPDDMNGCGNSLYFQGNGSKLHGLPILSGYAVIGGGNVIPGGGTTCRAVSTAIEAQLPSLFSTAPEPSPTPTASFEFGGCTNAAGTGSGGGAGGGTNPLTCPGEEKPTPNCSGHVFPPAHVPAVRRGRSVSRESALTDAVRTPRDDSDQSDACPSGDEDYTDAAPEAFVGAMRFADPYLCYDPSSQIWTAGGKINVLGAQVDTGPPPDYGISFTQSGKFVNGAIKSVDFNPALPIAPGVALASFSGGFGVDPTRIGLQASIQAAGVLTITGGGFAVWAGPKYPYTYDPDGPYSIPGVDSLQTDTAADPLTDFAAGAGGTVGIDVPGFGNVQLAKAYVFFAAPSYFEFGGAIGIPAANINPDGSCSGWCVGGGVEGAIDTGNNEYNISGGIRACADFPGVGQECVGLQGVVSDVGVGVCGNLGPFDGGFTWDWNGGPDFFGGVGPLGTNCDDGLGPVTVAVQRSRSLRHLAHVDAATGAVSLKLAGDSPSTSIYVKGDGAPPGVALTGPGGQRLSESGTDAGVRSGGLIIWPEPEFDETVIEIAKPESGNWTVTPLPGSPGITGISYANVLGPPKISTTVTGAGRARTLHYHVRSRPDQKVTFAERSGRLFHILGQAHGSSGELRFAPAPGPGGHRRLVALISLASGPAPTLVVGGYKAPSSAPGRPQRLHASRRGSGLQVNWSAAANATKYLVEADLSDGRRTSFEVAKRSLTLSHVASGTTGQAKVMALNALGQVGVAATVKIRPLPKPGRLTSLRTTRKGKRVLVTWHRTPGAKLYILRVQIHGMSAYDPEFLTGPRFVSAKTLPGLRRGLTAKITVTPVGADGRSGRSATVLYRNRARHA